MSGYKNKSYNFKKKIGNIYSFTHYKLKKFNKIFKFRYIIFFVIYISVTVLLFKNFDTKYLKNAFAMNKNLHEKNLNINTDNIEEKNKTATVEELQIKYFSNIIGNEEIAEYAVKYSKLFSVETSLLVSIMKVESSFNPHALNHNKNGSVDRGLCQLNNKTFKYLTLDDFFDPETNILYAARFLEWCQDNSNNNIIKSLAFYNSGYGNVKNKKVGETTLNYINKVLNNKNIYDKGFELYLQENSDIINNEIH